MSAARRLLFSVALAAAMLIALAVPSGALAKAPWWQIASEVGSTYLPPGGQGEIIVSVSDLGDEAISGAKTPVTITDELPPGLTATSVGAGAQSYYPSRPGMVCTAPASTFSCTYTGALNPYEQLGLVVKVKVDESAGHGHDAAPEGERGRRRRAERLGNPGAPRQRRNPLLRRAGL